MAIAIADLKKSVVNNWVMSGKDKALVESIIDQAIDDGVGMFWRERDWSFSLKTDTFTLTADTITGYIAPTDCDGIVRIKRETTTDSGYDMIELPAHMFDEEFAFPDALPTGSPLYFKVEIDNGTMKIFVFPVSDSSVTARRTYKMKYKQDNALQLIPADYKNVVVSACLYQSVPAITPDGVRMSTYSEYRELVKRAEARDKVTYRKLTSTMRTQPSPVNRNSWQFYLGGDQWED